jgi:hypothetical protein
MSTVRVNLEQDEHYDYRFHVRPEGTHEVSQETLLRWASVMQAYKAMQEEMIALVDASAVPDIDT